jgi:hypothetical protein
MDREMMDTHIEASKRAAKSHDWYDALNYLVIAAQCGARLEKEGADADEISNTLCRTVGFIGGEMSECDSTLNQQQ